MSCVCCPTSYCWRRHDTAETIERCHAQGIAVKMVTGDQQLIGKETARQLGMGTNIHKIDVLLNVRGAAGLFCAVNWPCCDIWSSWLAGAVQQLAWINTS
jgi:hypothetical protein